MLSGKNKTNEQNVFVISSLVYIFGISPCTDFEKVQPRIVTKFRMHYPNFLARRMNVGRNIRGRIVVNVVARYYHKYDSLCAYFYSKERSSPLQAVVCNGNYRPNTLNLKDRSFNPLSEVKSDQEPIDGETRELLWHQCNTRAGIMLYTR